MIKIVDAKDIQIFGINQRYEKDFHLTNEYRTFKEEIYYTMLSQVGKIKIPAPQRIGMLVDTYHDFDNIIKPVIDAIESVFGNDRNIVDFHECKRTIKKGELGRIQIWGDSIC